MNPIRGDLSLLVGIVLALTGCVRLGFDGDGPPVAPTDAGPTVERGTDRGGGPDTARDGGDGSDQSAGTAGKYEDCSQEPCAQGMDCVQAATPFCMQRCLTSGDCGTGESCKYLNGASGYQYCMQECDVDGDCLAGLKCAGYGPYPGDHCAPITPADVGTACATDLECKAGTRCVFGYAKTGHCAEVCPQLTTCPSTHLCFDMTWEKRKVCLRACAPLDSPVKCASHEVCYPNPELQQAYCIGATGDSTTCTTSGQVCVTGKICVSGACQPVCDASHLCPTPQTCSTLTYSGKTIPWNACK